MEFAVDKPGKRVHALVARKDQEYFCPICGQQVIPKQGMINVYHFAHLTSCADTWSYDMSPWHTMWQSIFPEKNREVVVEHQGVKHRADVMAYGYVLEFQHSPISMEEFDERNCFYRSVGKQIIWVFDMWEPFLNDRIRLITSGSVNKYVWKHAPKFLCNYVPQRDKDIIVFFQVDMAIVGLQTSPYLERVVWAAPSAMWGRSNFKYFCTETHPDNSQSLMQWMKQNYRRRKENDSGKNDGT